MGVDLEVPNLINADQLYKHSHLLIIPIETNSMANKVLSVFV